MISLVERLLNARHLVVRWQFLLRPAMGDLSTPTVQFLSMVAICACEKSRFHQSMMIPFALFAGWYNTVKSVRATSQWPLLRLQETWVSIRTYSVICNSYLLYRCCSHAPSLLSESFLLLFINKVQCCWLELSDNLIDIKLLYYNHDLYPMRGRHRESNAICCDHDIPLSILIIFHQHGLYEGFKISNFLNMFNES